MDFLEKVKKTATSIAKVSQRESKKLYSIAKLKMEVTEKENKVKKLYKEIGYDAYRAHQAKEDIVLHISKKLAEVDVLEDEISELREKIDNIKDFEEVGVEDVTYDEEAADAEIVDDDDVEPIDTIE